MNTAALFFLIFAPPPPTYSGGVAEIFHEHCTVCHQPDSVAPFSLASYGQVKRHAPMINEVVHHDRMPPWRARGDFANANVLTDSDREMLVAWFQAGSPLGDEAFSPPVPKQSSGWRMSRQADVVLDVPAFEVSADAVLNYQYFEIDPGFTEDKWVAESQILPGEFQVVHHAGVTISGSHAGDIVAGYVPGAGVVAPPGGAAIRIPAGAKLKVTMHYTPVGRTVSDQTKVGLVFADPARVERSQEYIFAFDSRIDIRPDTFHVSEARTTWVDAEAELISVQAHMHLRGQSIAVIADYLDGTSEVLLDVPRYDFNWQWTYELEQARRFPVGTVLRSIAVFDNSEGNPTNPDPKARVRWGEQTKDEMHLVAFAITKPIQNK